jgi:two-component system response regulator PilR (NtrC family)
MPSGRILVVDDERSMRELLGLTLRDEGYDVVLAESGEAALRAVKGQAFDLVVTDLRMRKVDGLAVLQACRSQAPATPVLVMTAYASAESAVQAMKLGAHDYVTKPFALDEITLTIAKALEHKRLRDENAALRHALGRERGFGRLIGRSPAFLALLDVMRKTAESTSTVLITGESGTGKELVAQAIHHESPRRDGPCVSVNCGALTESLMESELFGHVKGSFTGAIADNVGLFAAASGGTLFLDEITEIAPSVQVKLLRALQQGEVRRVGDTRDTRIDVRVIAASNRDLGRALAEGALREDLYYRLNVIPIHLPPLRERRGDIPLLATHFVQKHAVAMGKDVRGVSPEALAILERSPWPGNVRELENVIERALVLGTGDRLEVSALPPTLRSAGSPAAVQLPERGLDLEAELDRIELGYLRAALERAGGVQTRAAEILGVSFRQLRYKLQKHRLRPTGRPDPPEA